MKAKLYETSYNALGTDLVQSKVLQVGGPDLAKYYDGATLVSATVAGDWRLPGFAPPPIGMMCNDVYAKNTKTGDTFEPDTEGYTKWGMVGLSCTNMRMVARAMYDAGPKLTQQSFVDALRKLPPDPIGGIGGAPVVVYIDKKTTPTHRVREHAHLPVQAPGAARGHDLPHPGEHQGPHVTAVGRDHRRSRRRLPSSHSALALLRAVGQRGTARRPGHELRLVEAIVVARHRRAMRFRTDERGRSRPRRVHADRRPERLP